jgi:5'-deoxynucleotidase YfbR-like HD superfamily hydrolase
MKYTREEMALKYLKIIICRTNPAFADLMMELWYEYEKGKTRAAHLVREIDKLECIQQAVIYEERTGKDMSDIMKLKANVTQPELQQLLDTTLRKYGKLQQVKQAEAPVFTGIYEFLVITERLKITKRQVWGQHGIEHAESLSDHMYCTAILCLALPGVSHVYHDNLLPTDDIDRRRNAEEDSIYVAHSPHGRRKR